MTQASTCQVRIDSLGRRVTGVCLVFLGCLSHAWAQDISPAPLTVGGDPYPTGGQALRVNGGVLSAKPMAHYWNGSAFTSAEVLSLTGNGPWIKVANTQNSGYDSGFAAYGTTSTGVVKPVMAMGWVGTNSWNNSDVGYQIADAYLLVRDSNDAMVERMRWRSTGLVDVRGRLSINGGNVVTDGDLGVARSATQGALYFGRDSNERYLYGNGSDFELRGPNAGRFLLTNLRLDALSGAVIGTDPGGTDALRVGGSASFSGSVPGFPSAGQVLIGGGTIKVANDTGSVSLYAPNIALRATASGEAGNHYFDAATGGTSHGAWFWRSSNAYTQRMKLDVDGSLLLGSDPGGSETLRVGGTARIGNGVGQNLLKIGNALNNGWSVIQMETGQTHRSWQIGAQSFVDEGLDFTPSTTVGGTTFSTPAARLRYDGRLTLLGPIVTGPSQSVIMGPAGNAVDETKHALWVGNVGATGKYLAFGYDSVSDIGYIAPLHSGTNWKNLALCPIGGQVHVGGKITQGSAADAKLHVKGKIAAQEVVVTLADWSDGVFADDYRLPSLDEVAQHIAENRHLPGIPAEAELVRDGVGMGDMLNRHMAKIEELTLYAIDLQKQNRSLRAELDDMRAAQSAQAALLSDLTKRLAALEKP